MRLTILAKESELTHTHSQILPPALADSIVHPQFRISYVRSDARASRRCGIGEQLMKSVA